MLSSKNIILLIASTALLCLLTLGMLLVGPADISAATAVKVLATHLPGVSNDNVAAVHNTIIWNIRWQRIALAILVGSGLAIAGTCFQTIFKNPLADPFILGVSSGAALGAAVAIILNSPEFMFPFAFAGAMISLMLVYVFGSQNRGINADHRLLLAGIACGSLFNATLSSLMALHAQQMQIIMFWLMGSLANYTGSLLPILVVILTGLFITMLHARDLDVMTLGDEDAGMLGVDIAKVKILLLTVTTLVAGVCVSVSGIIGFIGLIVPHLTRRFVGYNHLVLLPLSAVWGSIFLLAADGLTRTSALLSGIPIGVVTALFGSPFFLYILYTANRRRL